MPSRCRAMAGRRTAAGRMRRAGLLRGPAREARWHEGTAGAGAFNSCGVKYVDLRDSHRGPWAFSHLTHGAGDSSRGECILGGGVSRRPSRHQAFVRFVLCEGQDLRHGGPPAAALAPPAAPRLPARPALWCRACHCPKPCCRHLKKCVAQSSNMGAEHWGLPAPSRRLVCVSLFLRGRGRQATPWWTI